jgi:hypothetical protein
MQHDSYIHLINHFRKEHPDYPCKKEQQFNNLLFRKFSGKKNEICRLSNVLEQQLNDTGIICRLITQLENENIPDYFRLSSFAYSFKRQVYSYIRQEAFTSTYYTTVLNVLKPLCQLIDEFQHELQTLLIGLKALQNNRPNTNRDLSSSEELDVVMTVIEQFLDDLYDYCEDLNSIINNESQGYKSITVTTHVRQYISKAVSFIEKLTGNMKQTQALLESWRKRLNRRKVQETYN